MDEDGEYGEEEWYWRWVVGTSSSYNSISDMPLYFLPILSILQSQTLYLLLFLSIPRAQTL